MQNRYVRDIGDYVKIAILPGRRLGVAWWLFPDESHNRDGRHVDYLKRPDRWRHLDPPLFDALKGIVEAERRNVRALEQASLLPGALFVSDPLPCDVMLKALFVRPYLGALVVGPVGAGDLGGAGGGTGRITPPGAPRHGRSRAGTALVLFRAACPDICRSPKGTGR